MNILEKIVSHKEQEVETQSIIVPIERLKSSQRLFAVRDFKQALLGSEIQIIAEIKRCSPSVNDIMLDADPVQVSVSYEANGANAISVLTDQHYFCGHLDFIQQVKASVKLPILRKDFIISEYQVWESFQAGADAILLIADAIDYSLLIKLYELSCELGMHTLVESHGMESLESIVKLSPDIVGVNCRNLQSMKTDIRLFESSYSKLPVNSIKIAESGIKTRDNLRYIADLGYDSALVGTSLMQTGSPGIALAELLNRVPA